eukprot:Skav225504  [mRNA]  locus=scaffold1721:191894:193318:- [translate_table: standard]
MPPKVARRPAAAKAAAVAKAAPVRGAANRGRGRLRLRRPAAAVDPPAEARVEILESSKLTLEQCQGLRDILVVRGTYWEQEVEAAGRVMKVDMTPEGCYLQVQVLGTKSEDLLRAASGLPGRRMRWHLCGRDCRGLPHEEDVVHLQALKSLGVEREPWMSNLQGGEGEGQEGDDEMRALREDQERLRDPGPGPAAKVPVEKASSAKEKKKKKKKALKIQGTKELVQVFQDTGLDPNPKVRKKFRKKASKLARKSSKGDSGSSSSSSSESSATSVGDPSLFGAAGGVQLVGRRSPGTLLAAAEEEAAESLLTSEGGIWDPSTGPLAPIFTRYYRAQLQTRMAPAMAREALTLSVALDLGLRGRIAELLDLLGQRLKALELQAQGTHYTVAQQSELVPKEAAAMTSQVEMQQAAKRAREEGKVRLEAARPYGSRQKPPGKGEEPPKGGKSKGGKGKQWKGERSDGDKGEGKKKTEK